MHTEASYLLNSANKIAVISHQVITLLGRTNVMHVTK